MLRIRDIFVRIQVRGSVRMTMDPDRAPDPAIFVAYYFLKVHFHHFQRKKVKEKSQNSRNQGFLTNFAG